MNAASANPAMLPASVPRHSAAALLPTPAPGLYIHVPFCARVCPYCDFAVQTGGPRKRQTYVQTLLGEIRWWGGGESGWRAAEPFDTLYLGGGTPSSLTADALEQILTAVRQALPMAVEVSITLEANPEEVDDASLAAWRSLGVSRLSLGVQSFDAAVLETLGRSHTPEQATEAVERSTAAGFEAVSLDLIFAVPGKARAMWESSLQRAVELRPHHISCYEFTVHQGTRFFRARQRGHFAEVADDDKAELFFFSHRFLADAGYPAYEVSNFARHPEFRSPHNAKYWSHAPYLGLGPSAHSFDGMHERWWNERRLIDWQNAVGEAGSGVSEAETLTAEQRVLEVLALGLRTTAGVDLEHIVGRYGVDLMPANADLIERLAKRGVIEGGTGARLVPTLDGMAIADTLAGAFEIPTVADEVPAGASGIDAARRGAVLGRDRP